LIGENKAQVEPDTYFEEIEKFDRKSTKLVPLEKRDGSEPEQSKTLPQHGSLLGSCQVKATSLVTSEDRRTQKILTDKRAMNP
jgi:hypothetical protein